MKEGIVCVGVCVAAEMFIVVVLTKMCMKGAESEVLQCWVDVNVFSECTSYSLDSPRSIQTGHVTYHVTC